RRESDAGDVAVRHGAGEQLREQGAAGVVDRATEARLLQWFMPERVIAERKFVAIQHLARAERFQEIPVLGLAADRVHLEAGTAEEVDGQHAHTAGRPGYRNRPE